MNVVISQIGYLSQLKIGKMLIILCLKFEETSRYSNFSNQCTIMWFASLQLRRFKKCIIRCNAVRYSVGNLGFR